MTEIQQYQQKRQQQQEQKKRRFTIRLSHRAIILWLSIAAFIHNIVMNGAMNVIISSLQKEFYLSSKDTGIYVSVYDVGSLVSSLIIPILGSHGSKPKWIGFGMFMLCLGCFVNVLPHFIRPKNTNYLQNATTNGLQEIQICTTNHNLTDIDYNHCSVERAAANNETSTFQFSNLKYLLYASNIINGFSSASMTTLAFSYIEDIAPSKLSAIYESIYYAVGALGMGVGFMITSQFLNIHNDIDSISHVPKWMKPDHPNWIGAWWLPFIIFGTMSFLLSMLLCTFPKRASNSDPETETTHTTHTNTNTPNHTLENGVTLKSPPETFVTESDRLNEDGEDNRVPKGHHEHNHLLLSAMRDMGSTLSLNKTIAGGAAATVYIGSSQVLNTTNTEQPQRFSPNRRSSVVVSEEEISTRDKLKNMFKLSAKLLKNPVFLFIVIASALEGLLQNSFLAFASLFIEYQYRIASATASFILGALSIPPLIFGSLLSGFLIKRFEWKMRACLAFLSVILFLNVILYTGFLAHCKEPNILFNVNEYYSKLNEKSDLRTNLTALKNIDCFKKADLQCHCDESLYKPVCLTDTDTSSEYVFQTACIAGCKQYDSQSGKYAECSYAECVLQDEKKSQEAELVNGLCPTPNGCKNNLIISYMTIFFVMFFTAMVYVPYLKVTFGCAEDRPEINAIALGIKQLAMTGIGTIPGPIIFGSVIDLTCKYWYTDCLNQKVCKIYSNKDFSLAFGSLGIGFKFICWLSVFVGYLCLKLRKKKTKQQQLPVKS